MQISDVYWDFAQSIRGRIREEVNGIVKFEVYEHIDTVIFKIRFKDFDFSYGVDEVQSVIYDGRTDEIVDGILSSYRKDILNAFFKSESRKKKDKALKLGEVAY